MNPKTPSLIRAVPALGLLLLAVPAWAAFTDNLNGTVTDTDTGLMWDKCSWDQTWTGAPPNSNTCSGTAPTHNWAPALARAVTANNDTHRGYNDWRLPSKNELESLVDITAVTSPAIDITAFPSTPGYYYWSSTTYAPVPAGAWGVYFGNGDAYAVVKDNDGHVRLVRSGQSFDSFDLLEYPITTAASPAEGGTLICDPNPVNHGSSSTCTATPSTGYSFANWAGNCTGTGTCTLSDVTAAQSVTAYFTLNTYPITTAANPVAGGTVACTPNPVDHGSGSTCTATPSTGYSFANWAGSCTGTGACTLSDVTAAQSVTANFTLNTYPITTAASPAEGGTVSCDPNPVPSGGTSNCTATPNSGYSFANWSGDCAGTGTCTLSNVTAAQNVTAVFRVSGVVAIPTVGPWGLALLTSLLAGLGGLQLRRGRRLRR